MESDRISSTPSDGTSSSSLQRVRPSHGRTTGPTRRSTKGQWTSEEDEILCKAVQRFKGKNWKKIAECFKDRTDVQCLHRWQKVLNPELVKGPWSKEEDEIIVECVDRYGPKKWSTIAQHLPGRIGKQCRERWHNHLNPAINKEAWTQDEELTLIRAHQIYGNKWAELTKFLPGRTDNSIKNHWNSSVKKKLESYLASGLLAQFPALPNVIHQNQSVPSSDDSARKEVEEVSECSQGSNLATSDTFVHKREDGVLLEDSNHRRDPSSSSAGIYTPAFEDISFSVAEVPNEVSTSSNHEWRKDWQFNPDDIPNISPLELMQDSSGLFIQCLTDNNTHDMVAFQQPNTVNFGTTTSIGSMVEGLDNTLNVVFDSSVCFPCENTGADSLIYQSSNYQISQDTLTEKCNPPHCSDVIDAELSSLMFQFSQVNAINGDGFLCSVESGTPFDNAMDDPLLKETKDSIPLVSVNDFRSNTIQTCPLGIEPKEEKKDEGGALCYEPPRFPSLDMPFFSCDLIQSGTDAQQEFSPLGIRQLMMTSSMNCLTPFRLWDSPSRDDTSPDAVLKSAAKTFTGTPSILKKRHRDLVSPLSEKRCEKKLESDCVRQASFSDLARDFSRLDVMFGNENATTSTDQTLELQASSSEDKENINPTEDERKDKRHFDGTIGKIKQPSGVLVELNASDLFFSPNRSERATNLSNKALGSNYNRRLEAAASNQGVFESSCFSVICSPRGVHGNRDGSSFLMTTTSAPPSLDTAETSGNGVGTENISSISGVTPYKWNIESPSAWKSPWFINSFLSSPRLDNTEINFEELALFLSPADKSYDAIGLMKQLSEQSAGAFADAQQVLGGETPESILRGRNSKNQKADENPSLIATNAMSERRTLDFSECGSPGKEGKEAEKLCANKTSFSSPSSSYLLKGR